MIRPRERGGPCRRDLGAGTERIRCGYVECVCVDYMYVRYVRQFTKGVAIVMHCVCWGEGAKLPSPS